MRRPSNLGVSLLGSALPAMIGALATVWLARASAPQLAISVLGIWTVLGLLTLTDFGLTRTASKLAASGISPLVVSRTLRSASVIAGTATTAVLAAGLTLVGADAFFWLLLVLPVLATLQFPLVGALEAQGAFGVVAGLKTLNAVVVYAVPTAIVILIPTRVGLALAVLAIIVGRVTLFLLLAASVSRYRPATQREGLGRREHFRVDKAYLWIALSSLLGPALLYADRLALTIGGVPDNVWISYVALSELLMKTYILPSSVMAVVFPWLVRNMQTEIRRIRSWYAWRLPAVTLGTAATVACLTVLLPDALFDILGIDAFAGDLRAVALALGASTVINWSSQAYIGLLQATHFEFAPALVQFALAVPYAIVLVAAAASGSVVLVAFAVFARVLVTWATLVLVAARVLRGSAP